MASRKQRQAKAIDEVQEGDILAMLHFFDYRCCYCNVKLIRTPGYDNTLELDHYRSLAGQDEGDALQILEGLTLQNTVPSCRSCNRAKYNLDPEEWIRSYCPNADEVINNIEFYFATQKESMYV